MKNDNFFSIISRLGLFRLVFGQVNEWPILELHEMIRVLHLVACPVTFILFYGRDWQARVFKFMKNGHFLVFLAVRVLLLKFLGG